jgi:hypothetical protein
MLPILNEPVAIGHQGGGAERRTITLGPPPSAIEPGAIDHEFWLTQPDALGQEGPRWVGDGLEDSLGVDIILNDGLERGIPEDEFIHQHFQGQCGVPTPGVEV